MNTGFDLSNTAQSAIFFEDLKIKASEKLINFSRKHTNIARFTGLPIALSFSLLELARAVSIIGEAFIKGIANIFGAPFSNKCEFLKGIKQIVFQFPIHLIIAAIWWPMETIGTTILTPLSMLISPIEELESKKEIAEESKKILEAMSNNQFITFQPASPALSLYSYWHQESS